MGFWNMVIYVTTSWPAVRSLFRDGLTPSGFVGGMGARRMNNGGVMNRMAGTSAGRGMERVSSSARDEVPRSDDVSLTESFKRFR